MPQRKIAIMSALFSCLAVRTLLLAERCSGRRDVAGNASVLHSIYSRFGDDVVSCAGVGMTHVGARGDGASLEGLGGAPPAGFNVFATTEACSKAYGREELARLQGAAWAAYKARMLPSFKAVRAYGGEETLGVWDATVRGEAEPGATYVCSLWPEAEPRVGGARL